MFNVKESFKLSCEAYNSPVIELIDYNLINEFVYNNTKGKMNYEVSEESEILFLLINVIYFKGYWVEPFNKNLTKKRIFENTDNSLVKIDIMYQTYEKIEYYEDENIQMIALPYISEKISFKMILILPNISHYSSAFEYLKKENINYNDLISKMKKNNNIVHLYLPKFKADFDIDLKTQLNKMNMSLAFSSDEADFSKLVEDTPPNLSVDFIKQKTYIEVDEEGIEAIAITMGGIFGSSGDIPKEYYMNVNHSFIYMIVSECIKDHNGNYLMPFVGTINKLEGENIKNSDLSDADNENNISNKINDSFISDSNVHNDINTYSSNNSINNNSNVIDDINARISDTNYINNFISNYSNNNNDNYTYTTNSNNILNNSFINFSSNDGNEINFTEVINTSHGLDTIDSNYNNINLTNDNTILNNSNINYLNATDDINTNLTNLNILNNSVINYSNIIDENNINFTKDNDKFINSFIIGSNTKDEGNINLIYTLNNSYINESSAIIGNNTNLSNINNIFNDSNIIDYNFTNNNSLEIDLSEMLKINLSLIILILMVIIN